MREPPGYLCLIESNPHGGFDAYALDLGVYVVGKPSRDAAIASLREGLALHVRELRRNGQEIPPPRTFSAETSGEPVWVSLEGDAP